jgi:hypothetical protein
MAGSASSSSPGPANALLPTPLVSDNRDASAADTRRDHLQLRAIKMLLPTPVTDPESGNGHARDLGATARDLR